MAIINTVKTGHGNKSESYSDGSTIKYDVFLNSTKIEIKRLNAIKDAVNIVNRLDKKINLYGPCNTYFKSLPMGKNFSTFWRDNSIFIDFSPDATNGFYGATHSSLKDVCISAWCLDNNHKWMIAATIIHEFAHVAGAPGGMDHSAEKAADTCGFKPQYNPTIMGSLEDLGKYIERIA